MNIIIGNTMKIELEDFSDRIAQEFDFGEDRAVSLFRFLLRLFGL